MRAVTPEIKTIKQPIQLLDAQHNGFVGSVGRCFEPFRLETLEPKAEAVTLPVEDFHSVTVAIQKNKKDRIEYGDFDIQLDQSGQAVDGFSEIHRLGVEVHLFDFGVGSHHGGRGSREIREHSIEDQRMALNVGFMARLR